MKLLWPVRLVFLAVLCSNWSLLGTLKLNYFLMGYKVILNSSKAILAVLVKIKLLAGSEELSAAYRHLQDLSYTGYIINFLKPHVYSTSDRIHPIQMNKHSNTSCRVNTDFKRTSLNDVGLFVLSGHTRDSWISQNMKPVADHSANKTVNQRARTIFWNGPFL